MRVFSLILSLLAFLAGGGAAQAGMLAAPGPNPNWTEMQQFEWYLGYMSLAARTCGSYQEADVLHRLARMTPYGDIGLGSVTADGFSGPVCGRLNNKAKELAADADEIEAYIEATYSCADEACYGQKFVSWKSHVCADDLMMHLAKRDVTEHDLREVTFITDRLMTAVLKYQARVRLKRCEGSLNVHMNDNCRIDKDYTLGDCEVAGVAGY
ncbi:hypothetical protein [Pelagibius sp. 7325]|uniref:hypothetical protein n=1 Tax=Pelagibius sp. 7325 TaxID=3131994 RepID=UPI0030EB56C9